MWEKGYQETDSVVNSVTTKAKGVAVTNTSQLGFQIWDVADYVIPAQVGLAVTSVRRQHFAGFVNIHWVAGVCHLRAGPGCFQHKKAIQPDLSGMSFLPQNP